MNLQVSAISRRTAVTAALCAAVMALNGCGESLPSRGRVHGTVMLSGKPLPAGRIRFFSLGEGVGADGEIKDGKYEIAAQRGLTSGKYRVEISAEIPTGRKVPDYDGGPGDMKDEMVESVPKAYNTDSTLQIDFDAKSDLPHNFDLK